MGSHENCLFVTSGFSVARKKEPKKKKDLKAQLYTSEAIS